MSPYICIWAGHIEGKLRLHDEVLIEENETIAREKFKARITALYRQDHNPSIIRVRNITAVLKVQDADQSSKVEGG